MPSLNFSKTQTGFPDLSAIQALENLNPARQKAPFSFNLLAP
jgi:hypothetical protein